MFDGFIQPLTEFKSLLKDGNMLIYVTKQKQSTFRTIFEKTFRKSLTTHTLYFVEVVVFLLCQKMRVGIFSGVNLSNKEGFEPAVFPES